MDTKRNFMRRAVRPRAMVIALNLAFVVVVMTEWGAYQTGVRAEARVTARRNLPANYCVSCHMEPKTVVRMLIEKDDNNGTVAYCAGVPLPARLEKARQLALGNDRAAAKSVASDATK